MMTFFQAPEDNAGSTEIDMENLIACLRCHEDGDNESVIDETLRTIRVLCSNNDLSKDALREIGGLHFLSNFLFHAKGISVQKSCLLTLATSIETNVHNQHCLTNKEEFEHIHTILENCSEIDTNTSLLLPAIFLLTNLVAANCEGQCLIMESGCLKDLIKLYRMSFPSYLVVTGEGNNLFESSVRPSLTVWQAINTVLCSAVNNPLNETNQLKCATLLTFCLKVIQQCHHEEIIRGITSFMALTIASNVSNQDVLYDTGGLTVLHHSLQVWFTKFMEKPLPHHNQASPLTSILNVWDAAVTDHSTNAKTAGELGVLPHLMQLMENKCIQSQIVIKAALTLVHCVDSCETNFKILWDFESLLNLIQELSASENEDLATSAKYLVTLCLQYDRWKDLLYWLYLFLSTASKDDIGPSEDIAEAQDETPRKKCQDTACTYDLNKSKSQIASKPFGSDQSSNDKIHKPLHLHKEGTLSQHLVDCNSQYNTKLESDRARPMHGKSWPKFCDIGENKLYFPADDEHDMSFRIQNKYPETVNLNSSANCEAFKTRKVPGSSNSVCDWNVECNQERQVFQQLQPHTVCDRNSLWIPKNKQSTILNSTAVTSRNDFNRKENFKLQPNSLLYKSNGKCYKGHTGIPFAELQENCSGYGNETRTPKMKQKNTARSNAEFKRPRNLESTFHITTDTPSIRSLTTKLYTPANKLNDKVNIKWKDSMGIQSKPFANNADLLCTPMQKHISKRNFATPQHPKASFDSCAQRTMTADGRKQLQEQFKTPVSKQTSNGNQEHALISVQPTSCFYKSGTFCPQKHLWDRSSTGTVGPTGEDGYDPGNGMAKKIDQPSIMTSSVYMTPISRQLVVTNTNDQRMYNLASRGMDQLRKNDAEHTSQNIPPANSEPFETLSARKEHVAGISVTVPANSSLKVLQPNNKCPGCNAPAALGSSLMHSQNFFSVMLSHQNTCTKHQQSVPPDFNASPPTSKDYDPYCFSTPSSKHEQKSDHEQTASDSPLTSEGSVKLQPPPSRPKRKAIPFTADEEKCLLEGAKKMHRNWKGILWAYNFHPARSAIDLYDKYRRIQKTCHSLPSSKTRSDHRSFTLNEDHRIARGVRRFGYNWKLILQIYKFENGRTATSLRQRWRTLCNRKK